MPLDRHGWPDLEFLFKIWEGNWAIFCFERILEIGELYGAGDSTQFTKSSGLLNIISKYSSKQRHQDVYCDFQVGMPIYPNVTIWHYHDMNLTIRELWQCFGDVGDIKPPHTFYCINTHDFRKKISLYQKQLHNFVFLYITAVHNSSGTENSHFIVICSSWLW